MARERKGEQLCMRISKEAKEHIKKNANLLGISQAKYVEKLAIEGCKVIEIRNDEFLKLVESTSSNLVKIGSNINQIAVGINSGKANMAEKNIETFEYAKRLFYRLYKALDENNQKIDFK